MNHNRSGFGLEQRCDVQIKNVDRVNFRSKIYFFGHFPITSRTSWIADIYSRTNIFYLFMLELNLELVFLLLKDFFFSEATVLYFDSFHPRTSQFPKLLHLEPSFLFYVFSSFSSHVMAEHLFQTFSWSQFGHS